MGASADTAAIIQPLVLSPARILSRLRARSSAAEMRAVGDRVDISLTQRPTPPEPSANVDAASAARDAATCTKMRRRVNDARSSTSAAEVFLELTDQELVARCQRGDHRAFRVLVDKYQRRAYGIAIGVLRNPEDARDAAQEAFIKVFRNIDGFKGDSSFYTWLYRIVVNVCIDHFRKNRRVRNVEYDETFKRRDEMEQVPLSGNTRAMHPGVALETQELNGVLAEALATLSENHRTIILLREVEGLSYEEIAEVMECHLGTVMSRLHHARKNLQNALKPFLESAGDPLAERAGQGVRRERS